MPGVPTDCEVHVCFTGVDQVSVCEGQWRLERQVCKRMQGDGAGCVEDERAENEGTFAGQLRASASPTLTANQQRHVVCCLFLWVCGCPEHAVILVVGLNGNVGLDGFVNHPLRHKGRRGGGDGVSR